MLKLDKTNIQTRISEVILIFSIVHVVSLFSMQPWRGLLRWKMLRLLPTLHPAPVGLPTRLTETPCLQPASITVTWALPALPPTTTTLTTPSHAPSWEEAAPKLLSLCRADLSSPLTSHPPASRWTTSPAPPPHALGAAAPWNALKSLGTPKLQRRATKGR